MKDIHRIFNLIFIRNAMFGSYFRLLIELFNMLYVSTPKKVIHLGFFESSKIELQTISYIL